jgi:hypothetical protein
MCVGKVNKKKQIFHGMLHRCKAEIPENKKVDLSLRCV